MEVAVSDKQKDKYVTFQLGTEYYGLKIEDVNEIIVFQEITDIPESAEYVKGLINLRGKIIPVVDVRVRFDQEPFEYTDRTCIIVVNYKNATVGLIVEKIAEVVEIPENQILPSPARKNSDNKEDRFVYAIGKVGDSVKLLLDLEVLLRQEDLEEIALEGGEGEEE